MASQQVSVFPQETRTDSGAGSVAVMPWDKKPPETVLPGLVLRRPLRLSFQDIEHLDRQVAYLLRSVVAQHRRFFESTAVREVGFENLGEPWHSAIVEVEQARIRISRRTAGLCHPAGAKFWEWKCRTVQTRRRMRTEPCSLAPKECRKWSTQAPIPTCCRERSGPDCKETDPSIRF